MQKVRVGEKLELSRIALGFWRLLEWKKTSRELEQFVESAIQMGITTMDHADIYGEYHCEAEFGKLLKRKPSLRNRIQLVTKCGIKLKSPKFPKLNINHYDTRYDHILKSVDASLRNLQTDRIDLLLIHRPDPLMDPGEMARAFYHLRSTGKVLNFGVSNFTPMQFDMLNKHFGRQLVTNQVEISPYCLEHFRNGNMDFFLKEGIHPMGWSPLAGGVLLNPSDAKGLRVKSKLHEVAEKLGTANIDQLIYAWILYHPAGVIPIAGSGNPERLKVAVDAMELKMRREHWYEIFVAAQGHPLP